MKKNILLLFLFTFCLILSACMQEQNSPQTDPVPPTTNQTQQQPTPPPDDSPVPPAENEGTPSTFAPEELTMELVVEWETADALLSRLEDMGEMLRLALEDSGYSVERVTLTISTAGGFTAEALSQGGIDAAVLPAVDFITCPESTTGIAMSSEEIPETVIALSLHKGMPDSTFCSALFDALTKTEQGKEFLQLCRPDAVFVVPTEEAMQTVADWVAQQEENGGHAA